MVGKNGSTKFSAPMALEQATAGGGEPQHQVADVAGCDTQTGEDVSLRRPRLMNPQREINDLKQPRGMLDRSLQAQLGRQLRAIFSDIANEPVPERFVRLLEALEAKEKRR